MLSSPACSSGVSEQPTAAFLRGEVSSELIRWQSPRWQFSSRPYSAASVVSLRCPLPSRLHFAGAVPANKLYSLLRQHFTQRTFSHTFGCMDAVQVTHSHSTSERDCAPQCRLLNEYTVLSDPLTRPSIGCSLLWVSLAVLAG